MDNNNKFIELDVREDLAKKVEPFDRIMAAVQKLTEEQGIILHTPFNPIPLHGVMEKKGFNNNVEKISADHWKTTFTRKEV